MGFSVFGLILVVVVLAVAWRGLSAMVGLFKGIQAGHATLICPHCGQETAPTDGRCRVCNREL